MDSKENSSVAYDHIKDIIADAVDDIDNRCKSSYENDEQNIFQVFQNLKFHNGDLVVLASRCWGTNFALHIINRIAVEKNMPTGYLNCGISDYSYISQKLLSINSGVSMHKMKTGTLDVKDCESIGEAGKHIFSSPLFISNESNMAFAELEFSARKMVEEQSVKLIVIDSLEYILEVADAEEDMYRYELQKVVESLKVMAKELNVPIVILTDIPDEGNLSYPALTDFRKYAFIPNTADMVLFLCRTQYAQNPREEFKLITAKNNHGPCGDINLKFDSRNSMFIFD